MRIVDGNQRLVRCIQALHAPRHRLQFAAGRYGVCQWHTQRPQRCDNPQQVGHVVLADEVGGQHMLLPALTLTFHHRKTQTLRTQADALGLQTGRPGRGHRPQVQPTRLQAGIQRLTLCVIHIHHGSLQARPCKQR